MSDKVNSEIIKYFKQRQYLKEDILVEFEKLDATNKIMYLAVPSNEYSDAI